MKWEYKAVEIIAKAPFSVSELLNSQGENGWELILCDKDMRVYIFKRPIQLTSLEIQRLYEGEWKSE